MIVKTQLLIANYIQFSLCGRPVNMLFFYVPDDGVYYVPDDAESRCYDFEEAPILDPESSFQFPTPTHPLNDKLADFFHNECGFFHYDFSTLYTKHPYQIITLCAFPALHSLVTRIETFLRLKSRSSMACVIGTD